MNPIHVIATTADQTRAEIEKAVLLANARRTSIVVWIPRLIAESKGRDDASLPVVVDDYRRLIAGLGGTGRVRVCMSHDVEQLAEQLATL